MTFEVEVYVVVGSGSCETILVDAEGKDEADVLLRMAAQLNSTEEFVMVGSGVFQKANVRGTCIVDQKGAKHGSARKG